MVLQAFSGGLTMLTGASFVYVCIVDEGSLTIVVKEHAASLALAGIAVTAQSAQQLAALFRSPPNAEQSAERPAA